MVTADRKKNTKILTQIDTIELLGLLKTRDPQEIADHFAITLRSVQYTRRKYNAFSDDQIDDAIKELRRQVYPSSNYPPRDYERQSKCKHENFTLFLKCGCTLTLGEKDLDQAIKILQRRKSYLDAHRPREVAIN